MSFRLNPIELIRKMHRRDKAFFPCIAAIGLVLMLLQWASGAWTAEFDGYPDEAAQFVTGRMVWEFLHTLPFENPFTWAGQYYLHYPEVAMGHWPPGYHVLEAVWSLLFGSSRVSAMWLQWFLGVVALTVIYKLGRRQLPLLTTIGILFFTIATPVFQCGLEQTMSELATLVCTVMFLFGLLRCAETMDRFGVLLTLISFLVAGLTKGTAIYLVPVPFVVLLLNRSRFRWKLPARSLAIMTGIVVIGLSCYWLTTINIKYWGGITSTMTWSISSLMGLTGVGFLGLALLGISCDLLPLICTSLIGSAIVASFVIRAINEPRHWIMILPAVLLLGGYACQRFPIASTPLLSLAILSFPWFWYHQTPGGYHDLARRLHLPMRMLISSGRNEGAWIADVAIAERYPASFVMRASKVLAKSGWNGEGYRLLVSNRAEVLKRLDELAVDTVIIDAPLISYPPHQALLKTTMATTNHWRICAPTTKQIVYCRATPPMFPRRPLALRAGEWDLEEKILAPSRN